MSIKIRSSPRVIESSCVEDQLSIENIYYDPDTEEIVVKTEEK